ncbi:MAG: hypothetical protein CMB75_03235 [Euryarchaeota archaeon]|nr:hypothetical protein [Euryarchaeota archaeon]
MFGSRGPIHLVHGPGNDCMLLCLQVVKKALISKSIVLWIGDLPTSKAKPMLGSISEIFLSNLLIGTFEAVNTKTTALNKADMVVLNPWCSNHGRARKSEISRLEWILNTARGQVLATSLGNQDASGRGTITARSRLKLEEMGFETWFLNREESNSRRILKSSKRRLVLERVNGEFSVVTRS